MAASAVQSSYVESKNGMRERTISSDQTNSEVTALIAPALGEATSQAVQCTRIAWMIALPHAWAKLDL
jgi:hypothetical protein